MATDDDTDQARINEPASPWVATAAGPTDRLAAAHLDLLAVSARLRAELDDWDSAGAPGRACLHDCLSRVEDLKGRVWRAVAEQTTGAWGPRAKANGGKET
jgi:hypothetical protein